jgi:hypothetical protein
MEERNRFVAHSPFAFLRWCLVFAIVVVRVKTVKEKASQIDVFEQQQYCVLH